MPNNVVATDPEVANQINRGLTALQKDGYGAKVVEGPDSDHFSIVFTFGESSQTMKLKKAEAQNKGAIEKQIVDRLNI